MKNDRAPALALLCAGLMTLIVNGVLTPMLGYDRPFAEIAASPIFLIRLSLATAAMLFLLMGLVGLYLRQRSKTKLLGGIAFVLAFAGTAAMFAHEWAQVFFVHPMAVAAPQALQALEDLEGPNLFDIESMAVLSVFTLGWIAFAVSMLSTRVFGRAGPLLLIAGFFAIPLLAAAAHALAGESHAIWGSVAGNVVLSAGWVVLGVRLLGAGAKDNAS